MQKYERALRYTGKQNVIVYEISSKITMKMFSFVIYLRVRDLGSDWRSLLGALVVYRSTETNTEPLAVVVSTKIARKKKKPSKKSKMA